MDNDVNIRLRQVLCSATPTRPRRRAKPKPMVVHHHHNHCTGNVIYVEQLIVSSADDVLNGVKR